MLLLIGVMILNVVISFINARNVGRIWAESRAVGGWIRLLAWAGAIQSAVGFTYVYGILVSYIAVSAGYLPPQMFSALMSLIYLFIIIPAIGSGIIITIQSWINFPGINP